MRRRDVIGVLATCLLVTPRRALAQQSGKMPRIGVLVSASPPHPFADAFRRGLQSFGYMTTPAPEMYRRIDAAVVDMINEFRIQRATGPLPDKALDQIVFRAVHSVVQVLGPYTRDERNVVWPSVLRMLLASFIREIGIADTMPRAAEGGEGKEKTDRGRGQ